MGTLSRQALTNVIKAFCSEVEKAGYYVGVYASLSWLDGKFYPDQLSYDIWLPSILLSASIPANMACGSTPAPAAFPESRAAWI